MKKRKILIKSLIIMIVITVIFNISRSKNNVIAENKTKANIEVQYEYNSNLNEVTAKIVSDLELRDTKPTWTLSSNKLVYTKKFRSNQNYSTPVQDKYGNTEYININITQVRVAKPVINYIYDENTNEVTAQIVSDIELKDTKPTWTLSADELTYTKKFSSNQNYSTPVQDKYGNKINVNIDITQVRVAKPVIKYLYDENTNEVTAQIVSDIELKDTKPTWTLSADKLTYTKKFSNNQNYNTAVQDRYGNVVNVNINISQVDKKAPKITLEYKFNKDNSVTINMKSNEKLGDTKPTWTLSEDKLTYTKKFTTDQNYDTAVEDLYGNSVNVHIKLKIKKMEFKQNDDSKITVRYMYTTYDEVVAEIVSTVKMEDTKPTWTLSEDGYVYTKIFTENTQYTTKIQDINGLEKNVDIIVDLIDAKIKYEKGTYGSSGAKIKGINGGANLEYYRYGQGPNVMFATFCIHGYEDSWDRDGTVLVNIANDFYNKLISDNDYNLASKWTIYIFPEVNPDGRRLGYTQNGPGRTTVYSKINRGIDINRSWQTGSIYKRYTDSRNYNGTSGFQAYEAESLRNFLLSHKSTSGQTVVVDLHGWEDQLIGDSQICNFYKQQYTSCSTKNYGSYGTQYLISWARQNLGAKSALIELPKASNMEQVNSMKLSQKYIDATLNMLRGILNEK